MSGDSMRITYIGHAGLRVDGADVRLLMDPWLSSQGAFQAAWYQFPANAHLDRQVLLDCDFVTVSHEHLDHMDITVLASLAPGTTVLIPKYPSPNFAAGCGRRAWPTSSRYRPGASSGSMSAGTG